VLANYPYFLFWFTAVPFVVLFFVYYLVVLLFTKQLTKEMRQVPQWKMAVIGILNTVNGIFILFASPNVPGVMQALLGPSIVTIPMAMLLSFLMLKRRYNFYQIFAVLLLLAGLGVAIYPSIGSTQDKQFGSIFWNAMFLIGSVPAALMTVYEEKAFVEQPIHIAYMLAWSTLWQMLSIFASFPVDAIPHFGTATSIEDIFTNQMNAFKCLAGHNIVAICPECDCENAAFYVSMFVLFYVTSSFFVLGVVKYGNAAFSFIVSTISTPITEFAFAWSFLMGSQVETISSYNYIALAILLIGIVVYRIFDKANTAETTTEIMQKEHNYSTRDLTVAALRMNAMRSYVTMQPQLFVAPTKPSLEKERMGENDNMYWTYP